MALRKVYQAFDLNGNGTLDKEELQALGTARRTAGHKQGAWSPEKNASLLRKMDTDSDGMVSVQEFVAHFDAALPSAQLEFDDVITQFMEAAAMCQQKVALICL